MITIMLFGFISLACEPSGHVFWNGYLTPSTIHIDGGTAGVSCDFKLDADRV